MFQDILVQMQTVPITNLNDTLVKSCDNYEMYILFHILQACSTVYTTIQKSERNWSFFYSSKTPFVDQKW